MSLVATRVQNWRVANPEFDRNMTRPSEYGALDFFIQQTMSGRSILPADIQQKAFASIGNTVTIPVINYDGNVTVSNVRSCVIADSENTSALYTVVFATYAVGYTMVPSAYMNNEITYNHDWTRKIEKTTRALCDALDNGAIAALEANKTQVFADLLYYAQVANSLQIPWDMRTEILGDINPMFRANDYTGQLHIIGNAGIDSLIRKLEEKGIYNDVNKQLEYANKVIHFTNNLANEAGKFATAFAVEDGNVGILTRVDREALRGANANFHQWDVVRLPMLDLPVGSHYYTEVGDQSGIAGAATADLTCAVKEFFGFSVDVAFIVAYNSAPTTIANPIMKFEIGKSSSDYPNAINVNIVNPESRPVPVEVMQNIQVPTVTTGVAGSITATTAAITGNNVVSEGTEPVTERGIVYATTQNPTTSATKVTAAAGGSGTYNSAITGLTTGTTYYARAYAINTNGTVYGAQVTIATL